MPDLTFVLPHWLYWLILAALPVGIMFVLKNRGEDHLIGHTSLPVGYFLLLTAGFVGFHRFYLRNLWGFIYIPMFIGILLCNVQDREALNQVSLAKNNVVSAEFLLERAQKQLAKGDSSAREKIAQGQKKREESKADFETAKANKEYWHSFAGYLALLIVLTLMVDATLLPRLYRECRTHDDEHIPAVEFMGVACEVDLDQAAAAQVAEPAEANAFIRWVDRINELAGNFVAYWSVIAVGVYYYEVLARYVFNSPTNWAHESMFLMFGMQYLLAGGYVLRNNGHVRVDVIYTLLSDRKKAMVDVATSVFFFIFACTLAWTGWIFFMDSFEVREVSFTEWAIQYYPIKFALPLGAALLLLQGFAWLLKDISLLMEKEA